MQRTDVLLLFGGESSEHDVSLASARNVYAAIDDTKYAVELGYIDRAGKWWLLEELGESVNPHGAPQLIPVLGSGSFVTLPATKVIKPRVILPILHGANGEDGAIAALGALMHIPVVGCDMTAGALAMDKLLTKQICEANHVTVVPYVVHRAGDDLPDFNKLTMTLGSPLFVKPTRSGSSVGVSKVYSDEGLTTALETAHEHSDVVLIERGVTAREIEIAVLGNPPHHDVSAPGEITPDREFYDYASKYDNASTSRVTIPAELEPGQKEQIQHLARRIYTLLGCRGLARIDFFLAPEGTIYLNEANTLPGFTNISMYPKLWRDAGVGYSELIEKLITLAIK